MPEKLKWDKEAVPSEIDSMLGLLRGELAESCSVEPLEVEFRKTEGVAKLEQVNGKAVVKYKTLTEAARAVGMLLSEGARPAEIKCPFKTFGVLLECSRNAVFEAAHLKKWLRRLALLGYNAVMLYMKDNYTLEGEDYFGYMRGRYSLQELMEVDAYARVLGIEMIGCIQALGHLEPVLRWPAYYPIRDTSSVLLVSEEKSYELIDKMISFYSEAYKSRRIHVGMDETHDLGRGRYMDINGYRRGFDIFNDHLEKVGAKCRGYGLKPMIWSDMYFRMGSKTQDYYDLESVIPEDVSDKIPRDVQLVYWDYYHRDEEFFKEWIHRHKKMGFTPMMASGILTWLKFWYDHEMTSASVSPCMKACVKEGVDEFILTMWGNDGAYCDFDSALAGACYAAEMAYGGGEPEEKLLSDRFAGITGGNYKSHITASSLETGGYSLARFFWDDPLLGIYWKNRQHCASDFWAKVLERHKKIEAELGGVRENLCGDFPHFLNIHRYLMNKISLKMALDAAYFQKSAEGMSAAGELISPCIESVDRVMESFRRMWYERCKTFGFEVIQIRIAGQRARLEELNMRIKEYCSGDVDEIPELEENAGPAKLNELYKHFATGSFFV